MSAPLTRDAVLFRQRLLAAAGYYTGRLDGIWGPRTDSADTRWAVETAHVRSMYGAVDLRSEREIETLLPVVQRLARQFVRALRKSGIDARIISGTRTYAEQDALYRQGRWGNTGAKVTNARGGQSNHNFGLAFDLGLFRDNGEYIARDTGPYIAAAALMPKGLEWGGDWSRPDYPHYQFGLGAFLAAARRIGGRLASDITMIRWAFEAGELGKYIHTHTQAHVQEK